jgi:hypothetical protein
LFIDWDGNTRTLEARVVMLNKLQINGYDAYELNGTIQMSVPNLDAANAIIIKLADSIIDKKIVLRISFPNKTFLIDSPNQNDIRFRCEDTTNMFLLN